MSNNEIISALKEATNRVFTEDELPTVIVTPDFLKNVLVYINQIEAEKKEIKGKFEYQQQVYADLNKIIKNQKTEIDGLKARNINNCRHWQTKYSSLRAEAIKGFAEKLQTRMQDLARIDNNGSPLFLVSDEFIDDVVKEMVGEIK